MKRLANGNFDITVRAPSCEQRIYRTLEVLSDIGAETIMGRATRVWKAQRVIPSGTSQQDELVGEQVMIKDIWVAEDRPREGDIYLKLKESAVTESQKVILDSALIDLEFHGDVWIEEEGEYDHTRKFGAWSDVGSSVSSPLGNLKVSMTLRERLEAKGFRFKGRVKPAQKIRSSPMVHYRMVLAGVHKPLYELTSLSDIFRGLSLACAGTSSTIC